MHVPTMAEMAANGEIPDVLFWVGCAGSYDQRAQKITKAFATILHKVGIRYAILGKEELCTGDPARRAGNEFMFQMMAYQNIQVLNGYGIKKIVTACPHCFNTLKNKAAKTFYETLSFSDKNEYITWISGAKKETTKIARLEATISKLNYLKRSPSEK